MRQRCGRAGFRVAIPASGALMSRLRGAREEREEFIGEQRAKERAGMEPALEVT